MCITVESPDYNFTILFHKITNWINNTNGAYMSHYNTKQTCVEYCKQPVQQPNIIALCGKLIPMAEFTRSLEELYRLWWFYDQQRGQDQFANDF